MNLTQKTPNRLLNEQSPYLLQHAYNPVDWFPWGEEALAKAKSEDKPIIVSIGYSSCHWCHVMEKESFEDNALSSIMNEHFVCIKVDREERPDIDQIYMEAVQVMGINGGWPLNVFLTPDQEPFYGGTYFKPKQWQQVLTQIAEAYDKHRGKLQESATQFRAELNKNESKRYGLSETESSFSVEKLEEMFKKLSDKFDTEKGGMNRSPKFPMPSVYHFLLRYYNITHNPKALEHINRSLTAMAFGGIYDQIGGGFSRYSVDAEWFAPHFEKMLYDNAQLMSLYSEAYMLTGNLLYRRVVSDSIAFLQREMMSPEGGFFAALDADSEGVEGKFYIWTYDELKAVFVEEDFNLFVSFFNVKEDGNWEHDFNILYRDQSLKEFASAHEMEESEFRRRLTNWKKLLIAERSKRVRPGLDDKILASWNGLMLKGLVDAYAATGKTDYLLLAKKNALFIATNLIDEDGKLWHSYKNGKASITPFLDDYAAIIQGYIALYQVCFDDFWLERAKGLSDYVLENFYDKEDSFFFFTDINAEKLIARKKELFDNVIPASNSIMASNLYFLGTILSKDEYINISLTMLGKISKMLDIEPEYLSNWGSLYTYQLNDTNEIVILGDELVAYAQGIHQKFIPNKVVVGAYEKGELPLLQNRATINDRTTIYICKNRTCQLPVNSTSEALKLI